MGSLAIIVDGNIVTYPATSEQARRHAGRAIGAKALAERDLSSYGIVRVVEVPPPAITEGQTVAEATPALIDGVWTQQWTVTKLDDGEVTAKLVRARAMINSVADAALPDLSVSQQAAIVEVLVAAIDPSPTAAKYIVVDAFRKGNGGTFAQARTIIDSWRVRIAAVEEARAGALKQLWDNGVSGIPAARALMEAL